MQREKSKELYKKALQYFPGGVNSPVRAWYSVEGDPLFIEKGVGCRICDVDGNEFIDFCCSWGPLILGHDHPKVRNKILETIANGTSFGAPTKLENELAELILSNNKHVQKIRFVNSGTEAVMSAIRLARGTTNRSKIIKFEGCYHGHADSLLVKAGSGLATFGIATSAGIPEAFAKETIVLPLNDREAVRKTFDQYKDDVACIIIEPIPANNGLLLQDKEYLEFLREISSEHRTLLIFDEVISGFRVSFAGAAGYYNIQPDIITYGKIIGGGLPVGAYGGNDEIMSHISPDGNVYQAGTLSGNPVAMAAGIAQLTECLGDGFYEELARKTQKFAKSIQEHADVKAYKAKIFTISSIFWLAFTDKNHLRSADDPELFGTTGMDKFKILHYELLERGVYLGPSGYEVGFVSTAHTEEDLKLAAEAFCESLDVVFAI